MGPHQYVLTKEEIKLLKKHRTLSAQTLVFLKFACMEKGCLYHDVKDATRKNCINFLKHFKAHEKFNRKTTG